MVFWLALMLATFGGLAVGIAALISAVRLPAEAFGPWWDNTRTLWIVGLLAGYVVPFGMLIVGIYWFTTGRRAYQETGMVARPFWAGPPKPAPSGPVVPPTGPAPQAPPDAP